MAFRRGHSRCGHFTAAAGVHGRLHIHANIHTHTQESGWGEYKIVLAYQTSLLVLQHGRLHTAKQSESRLCMCPVFSALFSPLPFKNTSNTYLVITVLLCRFALHQQSRRSATPLLWYRRGRLSGMCWIESQNAQTAARLLILEVIRSSEATGFNTLPDSRLVQWSNQSEDSGVYRRRVQDI